MMLTEVQDRDAIVAKAIAMTSAGEREAYIAAACGKDAALRRQVEERVAAHFQARNAENPGHGNHTAAHPPGRDAAQPAANHGGRREGPPSPNHAAVHPNEPSTGHERGNWVRKCPPALVTAAAVLLLAATGVSIGLAVWALRAEKQAQAAAQQAVDERDQAQKAAEHVKDQREETDAGRKAMMKERDRALAEEKAAQQAEQDTKAILAYFQGKVLSNGRPVGWAGGQGKDVTLRKALDAAESKVADAFVNQPLAEASIREMLGATYLDLEEAALAVKQYERAVALREAMQGEDHPDTAACRNKLAVAYRLAGRTDEASRLYDQAPDSTSHAASLAIRGGILLSQKKPDQAELKLRQCLAIRGKLQADDWTTFETRTLLGEALLNQKKFADAEPLLLSGYAGLKQREANIPSQAKVRLTRTLEHLVQLYESWSKKDRADQWRKELEAAKAAKKT
jgi:tetratricopeptide (TPR) repeat protein